MSSRSNAKLASASRATRSSSTAIALPVSVTRKTALAVLGISPDKFTELVRAWGLKHVRHGQALIVRTTEFIAALEAHEQVDLATELDDEDQAVAATRARFRADLARARAQQPVSAGPRR